jgi:hypothetical protein
MFYFAHMFSILSLNFFDNSFQVLNVFFFGYDIACQYFKYTKVLNVFLKFEFWLLYLGGAPVIFSASLFLNEEHYPVFAGKY